MWYLMQVVVFWILLITDEYYSAFSSYTFDKRETDYIIDETYWNDESPAGEVEKLLHDFPQNQELVRNIGASYYQIIYPTQLRRHEKMGISTRETAPTKMGKHYHRTSLLIKAFSHKFRLDLELNTQLLAPNLMQKHYLPHGAEQVSKQEIEHCYYHGTVKDIPGATAAFHTCNGISGVIHIGNETFIIHPFYGGDLAKHPHVIFESHAKFNSGCANKGNLEWRMKGHSRKPKRGSSFFNLNRTKRDVREATKYIETALIVDRSMFDRRNGSTRAIVIQDALQIANIVDLYFRTINTRVSVVYIETWQGANQISIDKNAEISRALLNFNEYASRQLFTVDRDTVQLITGERFAGNEAGMAVPESVCTAKSLAIIVDLNAYEPHITAATMAHMIGHNVGMGHDDGRSECFCRDWHGCIMQQSIVGQDNIHPYKFSECSLDDYIAGFRDSRSMCLLNKPNEVTSPHQHCGNKIIEENEDCDCGSLENCEEVDPCCDHITCKLKKESECSAAHKCCSKCKYLPRGTLCRPASNECDLPEYCSGNNGECPVDAHKKNGHPCEKNRGICYNGFCPTLIQQCEYVWGKGGKAADKKCYDQFNSKGSISGNCGMDGHGNYIQCEPNNVLCGSLQCANGSQYPASHLGHEYTRTIISIKGYEYECKSTRNRNVTTVKGLVRDGTPCGTDLICINQTCTSIFPHVDHGKCPSNHKNLECSSHGLCSNLNTCHCEDGWTGPDCSIKLELIPTTPPAPTVSQSTAAPSNETVKKDSLESQMKRKETPYENAHSTNTVNLVGVLMAACGGVFTVFTTVALCYRSVVVHKSFSHCLIRKTTMPKIKYDSPYDSKKKKKKSESLPGAEEDEEIVVEIPGGDKIPTYPGTPSCSQRPGSSTSSDSQHRVFYRPSSQQGSTSAPSAMTSLNQYDLKPSYSREFNVQNFRKSDSRSCLDEQIPHHHHHHHHHHPQHHHHHHQSEEDEEDDDESGPIRIRNLEDLIRQLEHHSIKHSNPIVGVEDLRYSETEADRQYRVEIPSGNEELRFVFGRFRHPSRTQTPSYHSMPDEERRFPSSADHTNRGQHVVDIHVDIHDNESSSNGFIDHHRPLGRSASEDLMPIIQTPRSSRHGSPAPPPLFYNEQERPSFSADSEFRRISSTSLHRNVSVEECSSRDTIESSGNENSALLRTSTKYPEYKH
ncbi:disintegrin and metalloproteinase domain-containing protein 11 isoform X3 [Planococcus citri]|uniref:disintegrin and metalloproteinase domain-containing protein 11 isoform X3 n=1 Tax=Planococcus citri TaxID=170843 RepID=UPI0031FA47C6